MHCLDLSMFVDSNKRLSVHISIHRVLPPMLNPVVTANLAFQSTQKTDVSERHECPRHEYSCKYFSAKDHSTRNKP